MFTHSCLIHKSTKDLRDKLSDLGYKIAPKPYLEGRPRGILCRPKCAVGIPDDSEYYNLHEYLTHNPQIIDCGTNERLFLAIAALRDDTDKNQWFVHNDAGFFMECTHDEFHLFCFNPFDALDYKDAKGEFHKATVEELIEHFSNNE